MKLIDWLAVGQVWFDSEHGEALTISSLDPDTSYPVEFRWNSGGLGRGTVEGFIRDNTPRDLVAFLRDRTLTATGPARPPISRFHLFALLHDASKNLSQRGDDIWNAIAATGPGSGAADNEEWRGEVSKNGNVWIKLRGDMRTEEFNFWRRTPDPLPAFAAPQTDHRAAPRRGGGVPCTPEGPCCNDACPRCGAGPAYPGSDERKANADGWQFDGSDGGHKYARQGTSDCAYGCGCWAGGYASGGPDGIDPLDGPCPKNPLGRATPPSGSPPAVTEPPYPGQFFQVPPAAFVDKQPDGSVEALPGVFVSPAAAPGEPVTSGSPPGAAEGRLMGAPCTVCPPGARNETCYRMFCACECHGVVPPESPDGSRGTR